MQSLPFWIFSAASEAADIGSPFGSPSLKVGYLSQTLANIHISTTMKQEHSTFGKFTWFPAFLPEREKAARPHDARHGARHHEHLSRHDKSRANDIGRTEYGCDSI